MPAPRRDPAVGGIANFPRASLAAGILVLALALSGNAGYARDRLPGDVERFAMIGFTVADVDRETVFFTKVLSLEKVADFSRDRQRIRQNRKRIQHEYADRPFKIG